ncbi:MAG: Gfo/Idh/MocA family oxidoreductase [Candidatus Aminicenantales bacterium]|jgi:predicted dehydrogenase
MIKVGIIGAGLIGGKRADSLKAFPEKCTLSSVCDVEPEKALSLAARHGASAYDDWRKLLRESAVDAIIIATPNCFLKDIAVFALRKGRHVLCEKPLGRTAGEAADIFFAAQETGKILKTGFNHRHHSAIWEAKRLASEGAVGQIYYIRCVYGHGGRPGYEKEWRANREICGGGELLDQGVHVMDLFRWFMGEFEEAYGRTATYAWNMGVEDNAFALFRTKAGKLAMMHTSWSQWKNKFLFEIFGEKGYLIVDGLGGSYGQERLIIGTRKIGAKGYAGGPPEEKVIEYPGPDISWQEEWREFLSAVEEGREPLGSGYDGLMANRMIEAVYRSDKENKPVLIESET